MKTEDETTFMTTLTPLEISPETRERRLPQPTPACPWENPTQIERPAFLLCFPFCYSTGVANNPWMEDLPPDRRQPDFKRVAAQFLSRT